MEKIQYARLCAGLARHHGYVGFPLANSKSKAPERGIDLASVNFKPSDIFDFALEGRLGWLLQPSRLAVIDWDRGKGNEDFPKKGQLRDKGFIVTQSGGRHYYYNIIDDGLLHYTNGHIAGVDVKHWGLSYVKSYPKAHGDVGPDCIHSEQFVQLCGLLGITLRLRAEYKGGDLCIVLDSNTEKRVMQALDFVHPDAEYHVWGAVGCALKTAGFGYDVFHDWSIHGEKSVGCDLRAAWDNFRPFVSQTATPIEFIINLGRRYRSQSFHKALSNGRN